MASSGYPEMPSFVNGNGEPFCPWVTGKFLPTFLEFFSAQVRSHDFTVRTEKYGGRDAPYTVNGTGFAVPGFQIRHLRPCDA